MSDPLYCLWVLEAPCLKPEVWAAWWQAVLSALAILAAARLASTQDRRHLSRKADVIVSLFNSAEQTTDTIIEEANKGFSEVKFFAAASAYRFKQLSNALNSIALQELPDYRLLNVILSGASLSLHLSTQLEKIGQMQTDPGDQAYLRHIIAGKQAYSAYYEEAAEIANEHHVLTPKQWITVIRHKLWIRDS